MERSELDKKIILSLVEDFSSKIIGTALELDDLIQEAYVVLILANEARLHKPYDHVRNRLQAIVDHERCGQPWSPSAVPDPVDHLVHKENISRKKWLISSLIERCSQKQKLVLGLLYGLIDGICRTYSEISNLFHVSVRQIEKIEREAFSAIRRSGGLHLVRMKYV